MNTARIATGNGPSRRRPVEILIVEDSATQAAQLMEILEEAGYVVFLARNGIDALQFLTDHKPAITISDVVMPEINGYELCRRIKATPDLKSMPVILLTSLSDPQDIIRGLECGADNFVLKPYVAEFLLSRIRYVLMNQQRSFGSTADFGIEIFLGDKKHFITSDRLQIIDMLFSTFEAAIQRSRELEQAQTELRQAKQRIEALERITSVCAECKRIRCGEDWEELEVFVHNSCSTEFVHPLCPDCMERLHPDVRESFVQKEPV